jgi:Tfp pilus assembly protein PilF
MLSLLDPSRCRKCHNERKVRKCPRTNKEICWECCNTYRYDLSCPASCDYAAKLAEEQSSPFPSFKADSHTEAKQVTMLFIDGWVDRARSALQDKSPRQAALENKQSLLNWLSSFQFPSYFPLEYLMQKLGLELSGVEKKAAPEELGSLYLDHAIALEWEELVKLSINLRPPEGCGERQVELLKEIKQLRKISTYRVIHGGLTDDGKTSLLYYELNHSTDWTLVLSLVGGNWLLRQNINGSPKDFFAQNERYRSIAEALSKGDDNAAWVQIQDALKLYPDSSDLLYYRAFYWQLVKQSDKAKVDFYNSIALDNAFSPSYHHLGILNAQEKNWQESIYWFEELCKLDPSEDNRSNLAAAYANSSDIAKAKALWREILKSNPANAAVKANLEKLEGV